MNSLCPRIPPDLDHLQALSQMAVGEALAGGRALRAGAVRSDRAAVLHLQRGEFYANGAANCLWEQRVTPIPCPCMNWRSQLPQAKRTVLNDAGMASQTS